MARRNPPGAFTGREFSSEDLAVQWGVTTATVRGWLESGLLQRNKSGVVDRAMLMRFVNSAAGQAALVQARNG